MSMDKTSSYLVHVEEGKIEKLEGTITLEKTCELIDCKHIDLLGYDKSGREIYGDYVGRLVNKPINQNNKLLFPHRPKDWGVGTILVMNPDHFVI
jgi:hypothetical protein